MQTEAHTNLLTLRSQPIGAISIDSPLIAAEVIKNLRIRGKEWRPSVMPEDLRKLKISKLAVKTEGSDFEIRWVGDLNPFYNPVIFGRVESRGSGSRIEASFKLNRRNILVTVVLPLAMVVMGLAEDPNPVWLVFSALMIIIVSIIIVRKRTDEPMRARLIEVLNTAARPDARHSKLRG
ncbi:MAG: hypothetical protein ACRENK_05090 [Gemmatimonadaceae bacterium]